MFRNGGLNNVTRTTRISISIEIDRQQPRYTYVEAHNCPAISVGEEEIISQILMCLEGHPRTGEETVHEMVWHVEALLTYSILPDAKALYVPFIHLGSIQAQALPSRQSCVFSKDRIATHTCYELKS